MTTTWKMERMVVHNRRTWIRKCWVGCGIVSPMAELRAAWAWGAQEDRCYKLMTVQVLSFLLCAPKQCVCVCFLRSACACDEAVLMFDCVLLYPEYLLNKEESRWYFPLYVTKGPDCICVSGLALFSYSHKRRNKTHYQGEKAGVKTYVHSKMNHSVFYFYIVFVNIESHPLTVFSTYLYSNHGRIKLLTFLKLYRIMIMYRMWVKVD